MATTPTTTTPTNATPMITTPSATDAVTVLSTGQLTYFAILVASILLYLLAELYHYLNPVRCESPDPEDGALKKEDDAQPLLSPAKSAPSGLSASITHSGAVRCLMLDRSALLENRANLRSVVEMGLLVSLYFLCDRAKVFPTAEKAYDRDLFIFLFVVLTCVALGASRRQFKTQLLLNRPQTEEWKGWMQVLFLLYHYFDAREAYNAIRVFIAGYVWMTGYGNFMYYYKTSDFSMGRFAQMMWRLNLLVLLACAALNNSYMLYYICPMHTIYTVAVYLALYIGHRHNRSHAMIAFKIVASVAAIMFLWHKQVFYAIWSPFLPIVGYLDPRKPNLTDPLHEWFFRSSLDRYVWIWGMVCAWAHPLLSRILASIDSLPTVRRNVCLVLLKAACVKVLVVWYLLVFRLPKLQYNELHPYTSWIPITAFFMLRNLTPGLRTWHLRLYGWLGCITLETYICQFHIWLHSAIPDGQPKLLLSLIPGYPLLNFALVSAIYVFVSFRLFNVTTDLKNIFVPHDDNTTLVRNIVMGCVGAALVYCMMLPLGGILAI